MKSTRLSTRSAAWIAFVALTAGVGLIAGCGKSDPQPQPGLQPLRPVNGENSADGGGAAPSAADPSTRTPTRTPPQRTPEKQPAAELESADPDDLFVILPDSANFEIVGSGSGADLFDIGPPEGDATSESFVLAAVPARETIRPDPRFRLPAGFTAVADGGYSSDGLPLHIRCNKDGSEMALVPAGMFERGKNGASPEAAPAHRVFLDAYYIDVTETTVGRFEDYRDALRDGGGRPPQAPLNATAPRDHPVVGVDWGDARAYLRWAGKDLPTEAQWEKAARGERGFDHPWGNSRPVWPRTRTPGQIDPVRSFRTDVSPYGVYDMAGNAAEWCNDFYSETAYQELTASSGAGIRNPEGPRRPSIPNARVVKGAAPNWTVWYRTGVSMRSREPNLGFRGVLAIRQ